MDEKQEAELFGGATQAVPDDAAVEPTQAVPDDAAVEPTQAVPLGTDDLFGDDITQEPTSLEPTQPVGTVESTPAVEESTSCAVLEMTTERPGAVKQEPDLDLFGGATQPQHFSELNDDIAPTQKMLQPMEKLESDLFGDDTDAALNDDDANVTRDHLAPTQAMDTDASHALELHPSSQELATQDPGGDLMDDLFGAGVDSPNLGNTPGLQPSSQLELAPEGETTLDTNHLMDEVMGDLKHEIEGGKGDDDEEDLFGDTFMGGEGGEDVTTAEKEIMDDLFGEGGVTMDEEAEGLDQLMDRPYEEIRQHKPRTYGGAKTNENVVYNQQKPSEDYEESEGGEPQEPQPEIADLFGSDDEAMEAKMKEGEKMKEKVRKTVGGRVKEEPAKVKEEPVEVDANHEGKKERTDGAHAGQGSVDSEPELEDEERDLFGELSEDETGLKGEVEEHCVRKRLLPDGEVFLFKIPNTLAMETEQFHPESLNENCAGFRERVNDNDRPMIELCGPENTIRWRLKRNEMTGEVIYDDQGDAEFESNAKFVEFEDGSIFLQVGEELFECQSTAEPRSQLYVEENNDLFVFHKPLTKQMHVIPSGIGTQTHKRLLSSQINKVRTHRAVKPISVQQAAKQTMEQEAEAIEAARREKEKFGFGAKGGLGGRGLGSKKRQEMDASYLESDELAEGPSLKALKKNSNMSNAFLYRAAQTLR